MAEKGDLVSQIVNGESEDDNIEEDCDTDFEVELLESSNSDRSGCLSNNDHGSPDEGNLDSPVPEILSSSTVSDSSNTAKSLMEYLRRPTASELSRKRKIDCNQPPKEKMIKRCLFQ